MKPIGAWVSVAALFVLGVLLGGLAVHIYYSAQGPPPQSAHRGPDGDVRSKGPRGPRGGPHEGSGGRSGGPSRGGFIEAMQDKLELTSEQRDQVREISEESRRQLEELRGEWRPQIERHMTETRERIDAVLTPDQRVIWTEMHRGERRRVERFLMGEGRDGRSGRRGSRGRERPGTGSRDEPPADR